MLLEVDQTELKFAIVNLSEGELDTCGLLVCIQLNHVEKVLDSYKHLGSLQVTAEVSHFKVKNKSSATRGS